MQNAKKAGRKRRLRMIDIRYSAIFFVILAAAVILITGVFYWLYRSSRQNLVNMWQINTVQMARDVEYYLTCPADAVTFASRHVEEMMRRGESNEAIRDYLVSETEVFSSVVDSNSTGIYGYCNGEYLNGSGWTPEADYVPTQRPWYVEAKGARGGIALVKPYLNLQTFTMMMSVSRLLYDRESVISMDIFLDGVQNMAEQAQNSEQVDVALVMDHGGFIVSHSEPGQIGKEYFKGSAYERELAARVLSTDETSFALNGPRGREMVFSKRINSEWTAVQIVGEGKMLGSLRYIYAAAALALLLVILTVVGVYILVSRKLKETEQLNREMNAAAEIYDAMYLINLTADTIRPICPDADFDRYLDGDCGHAWEKMIGAGTWIGEKGYARVLGSFMDLTSLEERMQGLPSVTQEYVDRKKGWMRMRFVEVSRDAIGRLHEVLWALESIDEDRRRQEHLRLLAETDSLTGIRNRSSGEALVRQMTEDGVKGMFLLLDVDRFKSFNDRFGHAVGDQVLVAVAAALRASVREGDVVFRLGGDEFAAYVPGLLTEAAGLRLNDSLLRRVGEINIPELQGNSIGVSIGATFFPAGEGDDFEALYRRADQGMYMSKQQGGNRASWQ